MQIPTGKNRNSPGFPLPRITAGIEAFFERMHRVAERRDVGEIKIDISSRDLREGRWNPIPRGGHSRRVPTKGKRRVAPRILRAARASHAYDLYLLRVPFYRPPSLLLLLLRLRDTFSMRDATAAPTASRKSRNRRRFIVHRGQGLWMSSVVDTGTPCQCRRAYLILPQKETGTIVPCMKHQSYMNA